MSSDTPPPATRDEQLIDLRLLWELVRKRRFVIVGVAAAVVVATWAYHVKLTPLYQATCSIVIESMAPRVLSGVEEVVPTGTGSYWSNTDFYETEYKILQSRTVAERVARSLALERDVEFLGLQAVAAKGDAAALERALQQAQPADAVLSRLTIAPVKNSKMVLIHYKDKDPVRAAALANAHAQAYEDYNLERRLEGTKNAAKWLAEQLGDLKGQLEHSELGLYSFKKQNKILAQSLDDRTELLKQTIQDLSTSLHEAAKKRLALRARIEEIERAGHDQSRREALPDVSANPNVQALAKMRLELDTEIAQLQQRYGDKYPKLEEAQQRRQVVAEKLAQEVDKTLGAIQSEHRIAANTEQALNAELQKASMEALELAKLSVEHNKLKRDSDNISRLYGAVVTRLKETDLTQLLKSSNVRLVDEAAVPTVAVFPRTRSNVALSGLIGLLLGLAVAFVLHLLDNTVKTRDDIEQLLGLTFLGIIPRATHSKGRKAKPVEQRDRDMYVFEHQRSQVAECSRAIRTNITFMSADKPITKLQVVSARPDEGKTTTAIHLATTLALGGHRTLLVDTDMRRPRLHRAFAVSGEVGLSNYLLGERPLDDVLKRTAVPGLDLLPCGPTPPAPAELLHSAAFKATVEALSARYDRIVFDSPPSIAVTDGAVLASLTDGVVFVVKAGATPKEVVKQGIAQLRAANAKILGAVLNDVDLDSRNYGYYYGHYGQYGAYTENEQ